MTLSSLKATLGAAVVAAVVGMAGSAGAATVTTSVGAGLAPAGATLYDFDNGTPSNTTALTISLQRAAVLSTSTSFAAIPAGSVGGRYLDVVTGGTATFTFGSTQKYFGLLWGSPDSYNTISFYNGNSLLASYAATDIAGLSSEQYVNFFTTGYNKVILASSGNSFEVDNVRVSAVPLPAALPLFGAALVGLGFWGRRRVNKPA